MKHCISEKTLELLRAQLAAAEQRVKELETEVKRRGGTICGERRFSEALCNDLRVKLEKSEQRVKVLEEALVKIRDYSSYNEPDEQLSLACTQAFEEANACEECKRIRANKWPPSGLCSVHYTKVVRAREALDYDLEHRQKYEPRNIAHEALEATCQK